MQSDPLQPQSIDPELLAAAVKAAGGAELDPETPEGLQALKTLAGRLASHPDSNETLEIWKRIRMIAPAVSVSPDSPTAPKGRRLAVKPGGGPQRVEGVDIPDHLNVLKRGRSYFPDRSPGNSPNNIK